MNIADQILDWTGMKPASPNRKFNEIPARLDEHDGKFNEVIERLDDDDSSSRSVIHDFHRSTHLFFMITIEFVDIDLISLSSLSFPDENKLFVVLRVNGEIVDDARYWHLHRHLHKREKQDKRNGRCCLYHSFTPDYG